jgi:hypothetical protein
LLFEQRLCLWRFLLIGNTGTQFLLERLGSAMQSFPELEPAALKMIAHKINGNLHQPRAYTAVVSEIGLSSVGSQEALLSKVFSGFPIAERCEQKTKYFDPIEPHDRIEVRRCFCADGVKEAGSGSEIKGHRYCE